MKSSRNAFRLIAKSGPIQLEGIAGLKNGIGTKRSCLEASGPHSRLFNDPTQVAFNRLPTIANRL
jgi:hypothetical protein